MKTLWIGDEGQPSRENSNRGGLNPSVFSHSEAPNQSNTALVNMKRYESVTKHASAVRTKPVAA